MDNYSLPVSASGKTADEIACLAARKAGELLLDHFYLSKKIKHKGRGNIVTEADTLSEEIILELLNREYPAHSVLSEETNSSTPVSGYTWIIDPLDGTNNYFFGVPHFCVNIALSQNKDLLLGITYDPLKNELFKSVRGKGSDLNGAPIHVSPINALSDSLIGFDLGYDDIQGKNLLDIANKLWAKVHCLRMMGSSALGLAYVACGRISLYFHRYVYPWDIASGLLLIAEAGGLVMDWQKERVDLYSTKIIASNKALCYRFIESCV
jgi:myo-inositol-1(or 4)-monophosphatase